MSDTVHGIVVSRRIATPLKTIRQVVSRILDRTAASRRYVARQREQSLDHRSRHVASSDPLLLSALSSFCCAGWLLPVALPLLLASLLSLRPRQRPHCTGVVTIIALASLLTAATTTAVVHCHRQMQPSISVATRHRHSRITSPSRHRLAVFHCRIAAVERCHAATAIKRPHHHLPIPLKI